MTLMIDRKVSVPPGFAERSCLQVSYRLPGLRHCYVLCHDASPDSPNAGPGLVDFFIWKAEQLALETTGDPQAYMVILSGASIRRRPGLHMHVFIVRYRWQKAWVYLVLGAKNLGLALWQAFRRWLR
ncbi:hypothetical protein [Massilia sp. 9I]|uniref:hypothetical protein n=1 Tax=Massilia sp. 9I TaxID=2653152 RepID=UPI0012F38731|nr:hypothetical protein [Massilia sp. 9I]VXC11374.1 conserved hypothetical protein [Massilia sp. 9I]